MRILVAEDDELVRRLVTAILRKIAGADISEAANGDEALVVCPIRLY